MRGSAWLDPSRGPRAAGIIAAPPAHHPRILGLVGSGYGLLAVFNPAYVVYYPALVMLCVGTAAVAATGPCAPILMLTGHEGRYLGIIAASVVHSTLLPLAGVSPDP